MAKLSAHGTEIIRLRKGDEHSNMSLSFRSDLHILQKRRHGTYDSGWKLFRRAPSAKTQAQLVETLKAKGWKEVRV